MTLPERRKGTVVRVAATSGLLVTIFRLGVMVERNSEVLTSLVRHVCQVEEALQHVTFDRCVADFPPPVPFLSLHLF